MTKKSLVFFILMVACVLAFHFNIIHSPFPPAPSALRTLETPKYHIIPATKSARCKVQGPYQDRECTPGAIFNVTAEEVCVPGYSARVRNVSLDLKHRIYDEYGISHHKEGEYEVDHLISLELGGSNDPANLWPEAAAPTPGFHEKDEVENYLHDEMCGGRISITSAQDLISNHWLEVYQLLH